MTTTKGEGFFSYIKIFIAIFVFSLFFATPITISAQQSRDLQDNDISRIDPNRTYYYMEKYSGENTYFREAVYFDSSGTYLGHRRHGNEDGSSFSPEVTKFRTIGGGPSIIDPNDPETFKQIYVPVDQDVMAGTTVHTEYIGGSERVKFYRRGENIRNNSATLKTSTFNFNADGTLSGQPQTFSSTVPYVTAEDAGDAESRIIGNANSRLGQASENFDILGMIAASANIVNSGFDAQADNIKTDDSGVCILSTIGIDSYTGKQTAGASFWNCIEQVLYGILKIFAWALGFAVWIFNYVFELMVVGMSKFINRIDAIGSVWKVFRDVANISFIFILLYLAISTILGINEHGIKHTLSKLILVAILMNFSMFFAKVVVDASNILAISFYKKIQPLENTANFDELVIKTYTQKDNKVNGIAGAFMGSFSLQKIFTEQKTNGQNLDESELFAARPDAGTTFVMGSIAIFIVFCIFLAASIIFIKRMTVIIVLIMTSSLAFAATLFHQTEGKAREWWEKLMAEAFYAPVFVAIIWLALLVMTDNNFAGSFSDKESEGWFNVSTVINYIIVINFFVMALVVGEKMGASGASGAMKSYKWLKSNLGGRPIQAGFRRYVGSRAYKWLEGKEGGKPHKFVQWATAAMAGQRKLLGSSKLAEVVANVSRDALKGMTDAQIAGAGKSFRDDFADTQHAIAEHEYEIKDNINAVAKFYSQLSTDGRDGKELGVRVALEKEWEKKDSKFHADVLTSLEDLMKKANEDGDKTKEAEYAASLKHLTDRLSPAQKDEMERKKEGALAFHRQKFDELTEGVDDGHGNKTGGLKTRDAEIKVLTDQLGKTSDANEKAKIHKKIEKLNNLEFELRSFVKSLNATQQAGLRTTQKMDERIRPVLDSETILSMSKSLNQKERDLLGKETVKPAMDRFQTRVLAHHDGGDVARRAILDEVNKYKKDVLGKKVLSKEDMDKLSDDEKHEYVLRAEDMSKLSNDEMHEYALKAMDYYDQNIRGYDSSMTQGARNMSRTMGIDGGGDGEKIKKEGDIIMKMTKAKQGESNKRPDIPK